jgi:hypothetical protein
VLTIAVLQHSPERVVVDLKDLEQTHNARVAQLLHQNSSSFPFRSKIFRPIRSMSLTVAVLKHGTEGVVVDLEDPEQAHDARVVQLLVDLVLPDRVPHVALLLLLAPVGVQLVQLARHVAVLHEIKRLGQGKEVNVGGAQQGQTPAEMENSVWCGK